MRRATHVIPAGDWAEADTQGSVTLAYDDRHRRRIRLTDDSGEDFLLDLAEATRISDGNGLAIKGGGILKVLAADEDVMESECLSPG